MSTNSKIVTPVSAPPAQPLSDEERRKRFAELRSRMAVSRLKVEPPPGLVGYWARKNDEQEMSRLEYLGFSIVHDDPKNPRWKASGMREDGTYCLGDVILLQLDAETYQFYLDEDKRKADSLVPAAKATVEDEAAKQGVPTFRVEKPPKGA